MVEVKYLNASNAVINQPKRVKLKDTGKEGTWDVSSLDVISVILYVKQKLLISDTRGDSMKIKRMIIMPALFALM